MPATHELEVKLPAVSGSSGKLVIEHTSDEAEEKWHPGQIFAQPDISYEDAMNQFVADSQLETSQVEVVPTPQATARAHKKAEKKVVRQQAEALKIERRKQREKRQAEDALWREKRAAQREENEKRKQERKAGQRAAYGSQKAVKEEKRKQLEQRRAQKEQRRQEDAAWRQTRQEIRQSQQTTALAMGWIAILVIADNCTRQCLGLPLFITGARVTAELVVEALRALLPPELQFLISDRGVHFTAKVFQQLAENNDFVHVLIARHRPQSNGIAERFVRTLKEWLKDKSWESAAELEVLLIQFRLEYNDRPHQGLPISGLSPNEYARRLEGASCVTNP